MELVHSSLKWTDSQRECIYRHTWAAHMGSANGSVRLSDPMDTVQMKNHTSAAPRTIPATTDAMTGHTSRLFTGVGQVEASLLCCRVTRSTPVRWVNSLSKQCNHPEPFAIHEA